jgi:aminomethyltransferase
MTALEAAYRALGAQLAPDGIPLHFGDPAAEFAHAAHGALIFDRTHEGRIALAGPVGDALALVHRQSTNDVAALRPGEARPTLFLNAQGRILDRVQVWHQPWGAQARVLVLTEPGRGDAVTDLLRRSIFFNDPVHVEPLHAALHTFALHGAGAVETAARFSPALGALGIGEGTADTAAGWSALRVKPVHGAAFVFIVTREAAAAVWQALHAAGARPSGGVAYNMLRIQAGRPAPGRELTGEYIPLELGLWDEVSFTKGCYTGQEIIARMESRGRQARVMLRVRLGGPADAPLPLRDETGREAGTLTSAVTLPDGDTVGIAVVKTAYAEAGSALFAGESRVPVLEKAIAGVQRHPVGGE